MGESPDGVPGNVASRVIVKNVPKHATEQRLRETFAPFGEVTDCRVKLTKDGRSRQFAFVGFRNPSEAKEAVENLNRSFFDTARILVELAHAPGSEALARPWSRYAAGSSAHKRLQDNKDPKVSIQANRKKEEALQQQESRPSRPTAEPAVPAGARKVQTAAVAPRKAGVASHRVHVEFGSDDEDAKAPESSSRTAAFDEDLDDLAYLRAKASKKSSKTLDDVGKPSDESVEVIATADSTGKVRRKRRKAVNAAEVPEKDARVDPEVLGEAPAAGAASPEAVGQSSEIKADSDDDADKEELETSGRLYVTNVPYGATEDEMRAHFEPLGEVATVHLCRDEDSLKSRGFAYVSYVFPECAVRALSELDMRSFQGRLLRVAGAKARPPPPDTTASAPKVGGTSSYKRRLAEKQKKVDAHLEHTWNLLYVSSNSAADAAAAQLGLTKGDILGKDADNAAVTSALTETSVLQQTKKWLQQEGVRVEAFEQSGASLAKCKAKTVEGETKRRQDSFIVKHLPAGASVLDLRERFARCGELVRCSVAPSGTVAIVQYAENASAQRAFQKLAFSKYKHAPLYLEWAPEDAFIDGVTPPPLGTGDNAKDDAADQDEDGLEGVTSLFVKNLSFSTTDATLKAAFRGCKGLRSAVVMRKKAAVGSDLKGTAKASNEETKGQSMGYGFVEFSAAADAKEAMKRKQGMSLEGHVLQLQVSQRGSDRQGRASSAASIQKKGSKALSSPSLCVRNLAFEVKNAELRQLFGAYGSVTAVRIPKKANYDGHRGFAFIDFASKAEAAAAFEALQHTHLYGRRLVIEAAEEKATDVASVQQAAQKRQASKGLKSEATKRRRASVLNTGGPGESFEDALMA
jgi:multiple RNA-binding domain-containing protein 1